MQKHFLLSQFLMELPHEEIDVSHAKDPIIEDLWDDSPQWGPTAPIPSTVTNSAAMLPGLLTAADLEGPAHKDQTSYDQSSRNEPDMFCQGMVVRHPEYGLGKIVALSGNGDRRMATVTFFEGAGQKKFIVKHSPLQPVKSK